MKINQEQAVRIAAVMEVRPETLQRMTAMAETVADAFRRMWQAMVETVKQFVAVMAPLLEQIRRVQMDNQSPFWVRPLWAR